MSDTPRTDEFIGEHSEWSPAPRKNWPAFACQLERELNTANERIKRLEEAGDNLHFAFIDGYVDEDSCLNAWLKAKEDK